MAALTKTVDGKALPADKFAYVGDRNDISTWHLPIDDDHIGSAVKMFGHEQHVPQGQRKAVARRIANEAKHHGIDTKDFEAKYLSSEHAERPDPANGWIEIFRAGDYSNQGKARVTAEDLQRVVENYDPAYHEAPVCVGHPQNDGPAYAWVDRLALDGDSLYAKEKQVDPAFDELRRTGRFKKRSAAFYQDANGAPVALRHVGWLGAQPPAVKGLRDAAFNDTEKNFIEFTFDEEERMAVEEKTVREQIAAFFAETFGKKPAQSAGAFSEDDVKRVVAEATKPLQATITSLQDELKQQKTKFTEREGAVAAAELKQRSIVAINKLKGDGRWVPAFDKMQLPAIFSELAKSETKLEFGEGDAKKQVSTLEAMVQFMEALPRIVPSGRLFDPKSGGERKPSQVHFSEGRGVKADMNSVALNDQATTRAKEKNISFSEALDQVVADHPELCVPGGSQAGAV